MRRRFLICSSLVVGAAQTLFAIAGVDRAPAPAPQRPASFTKPNEVRLDNGMRLIVAERPALPLLAAQVVIRSGAETDPPNLAGAASMTASLLTKGTEKMSAPEIAGAIESLGGSISSGAGWDSSNASIVVMSDKAEQALGILAEVVLHPTFKQEEIDRQKRQVLDGLRVSMQQPGSLAMLAMPRIIFGSGEYGHQSGGTVESIQALTSDAILKLYRSNYRPSNAALVLVGKLTLEQGRGFAQKFFGSWKDGSAVDSKPKANDTAAPKPQNVVIDMPEAGQAAVNLAKPAIKRSSPDYYTGVVATAALGNGFASRLNREIRIKRGLSYGARSSLDARRDVGPFVASAQTKNESAAEVAKLMQAELQRLASEPVAGEELRSRQAMLTGGFARSMETNEGVAGHVASLAVHNLPLDTLNKFIPSINAVTTEQISAFATKYLAQPPSVVIAGKAAAFADALKKEVPDVKVITQHQLDLNRPDLTKQK